MPRKIGLTSTERKAVLRNQASYLLWYGSIKTTAATAKETQSYVEKIITLAVNTYTDTVEETVTNKDKKGKEVSVKAYKDGAKKLAARRKIMALTYDIPDVKGKGETKKEYKERTQDVKHPLVEKIFNEIAPKYADRAEKLGQKGGYTRIYLLGERKGDAAEMAKLELVD